MIIGRKRESQILNSALQDNRSHFIAVYGRRRIGKTFLVRETFGYRFTFQHAGMADGGMRDQLEAFRISLKDAGLSVPRLHSWSEAFEGLKDLVRNSTEKRKTIFIDELSWMDTPKSRLVPELEHFWNSWASARQDIVLIVCASATSWMLSEIVHNKGGLYNRLTDQIHLHPFTLSECEEYVKSGNLAFNRSQIMQYYMVFGGVPFYWTFIRKGLSIIQNIDGILFSKDAPLKEEFKYLYASIFKKPAVYLKIVETLGKKKVGMTRDELIHASGLPNSGDLTRKLEELESCGFIRRYKAFGHSRKDSVYQLIDFFTLFHYKFLADAPNDEKNWANQINTPLANTWTGLAFERVCMEHIPQIKRKLGISGILSDVSSLYCRSNPEKGIAGSQIDLLIARKDQVINLCEMKYSNVEYTLTETEDRKIKTRINDLILYSGTKSAVFPTLITTYGLVENSYSGNIQSIVTMDDLFVPD
jgi:hypothetical protein